MTRSEHGIACVIYAQLMFANANLTDTVSIVINVACCIYSIWHLCRFTLNI